MPLSAKELARKLRAVLRENSELRTALTTISNPNHCIIQHTTLCRQDRLTYSWHPCSCGLDDALETTKKLLNLEEL